MTPTDESINGDRAAATAAKGVESDTAGDPARVIRRPRLGRAAWRAAKRADRLRRIRAANLARQAAAENAARPDAEDRADAADPQAGAATDDRAPP